jgi:hypothetical protein
MSPNELSELASIAETLNQESNEINETIASFNKELAALNLGIEVWCGPWDEDPCQLGVVDGKNAAPYQIGFARFVDGKNAVWELAFRSCIPIEFTNECGDKDWKAKPWSMGSADSLLRAPRNVRIEGLTVVSQIISSLKASAQDKINAIRDAKKIAANWR